MFEHLWDSLRGLSARLAPEERQRVVSSMRDAMVHARMALEDLRKAIQETRLRLNKEQQELATVVRRRGLADGIGDTETVEIADRFAAQHEERIRVLEVKLMSQEQELTLGEREYEEMKSQLRMAMAGVAGSVPSSDARTREIEAELDAMMGGAPGTGTGAAGDDSWTQQSRSRADREADAEERLAALKRKLGR